jgi:hypothetical protein
MTARLTEPQQRLLAAFGADPNESTAVRISTRIGRVWIGDRPFPLADLHVLRAYKLIRERKGIRMVGSWVCEYRLTDTGQHLLDTARPAPRPAGEVDSTA